MELTELGCQLRAQRHRREHPDTSETEVVDLLFASSGIEPEIVAAAEPLEVLPGLGRPCFAQRRGDR